MLRCVLFFCVLLTSGNPPAVKHTKASLKTVYLTFDDGPMQGSELIDSVALAEQLRLNVFLVGAHVMENPQLKNYFGLYEQNPYIECYNHSYTHAHNKYTGFYKDPAGVLAHIQKNELLLHLKYKSVRLPGRNIWRTGNRKKDDGAGGAAAADLLAANGYKLYGWDAEWRHQAKDGEPVQTAAQILLEIERLLNSGKTFTKDHIVILLHDEMFKKKWEETALKQLIDSLRTRDNYIFEHIRFYPDQ